MIPILDFTVSDIRGALAGALVGLLLGWITAGILWIFLKAKKQVILALARDIWKSFIRDPKRRTVVVLTTKPSARPSGTPKVSLSEVQGYSEVRRTLANLGTEPSLIENPDTHLNQLTGFNIVSIGGPKWNHVTREILAAAKIKNSLMPFSYEETTDQFLLNGSAILHSENQNQQLTKDFGIVMRVSGLLNDQKQFCMVMFGLRGHGTWGAVQAVTVNKKILENIESSANSNDFALLLELDFNGNQLISSRIASIVNL